MYCLWGGFALANRLVYCAASLMVAVGVSHNAAAGDADQQMALRGECVRLLVSGKDFTPGCEPVLISKSPSADSIQFQFLVKNGATLSIVGSDLPGPTDDIDQIKLVRFELNLGIQGVASSGGQASGQCTFNNPFAGKMTLSCEGTVKSKPLSLVFISDGKAPQQ